MKILSMLKLNLGYYKKKLRTIYHLYILYPLYLQPELNQNYINNYFEYKKSDNPKKIESLKGLYKGSRCFIIGNGPSLSIEDMTLIRNEYTFASNYIIDYLEKFRFKPEFYFIQDYNYLQDLSITQKVRTRIINSKTKLFVPFNLKHNFLDIDSKSIYNFFLSKPKIRKRSFSFKADEIINDGWTVSYSMVQFAIYMGFNQIYLIGMDNTSGNHFYENKKSNSEVPLLQDMSWKHLSKLRVANVSIINVSRGGKLDYFKRQDLHELF